MARPEQGSRHEPPPSGQVVADGSDTQLVRGVAQPYLGARATAELGDMMADGGETPDSSRPLILSGTLAPRSDDRRLAGASRGHQLNRAEARTGGHGSGCLLLLHLSRRQPDLVAEVAQRVIAPADQLAGDRQRWAFAAESITDRVVVIMVWRSLSSGGLGSFEECPAQLGRALASEPTRGALGVGGPHGHVQTSKADRLVGVGEATAVAEFSP